MSFLVSVIIPNHNYERFIGAAIDSALALDWPNVEVIVVDDGSTDNSRSIIQTYGDRVIAIFQERATQRVACNTGFARSRGEVVIFLDSDDLLQPSLIREIASIWRPGISKVQFQMARIDAAGVPDGSVFPQFDVTPTPDRIRDWMIRTSAYPTPPGSGNAYARAFLERLFPLDASCGDFSDSAYLAAAPFLGDIVTVAKPLVYYRVHGGNDGAFTRLDVTRFSREMVRAHQRFAFAQKIAKSIGIVISNGVINNSPHYLQHRIVSLKLAPHLHPLEGDRIAAVLCDHFRALVAFKGAALRARLAILVWSVGVAISPRGFATRLVLWKFAPATQPRLLHRLLVILLLAKEFKWRSG